MGVKSSTHRVALLALLASGLLWGVTVPLSKLALGWLDPAWLTFGRFTLAALVLGTMARRQLRAAVSLRVAAWGAAAFGAGVTFQNIGLAHTSVAHASVLMGVVPALVALAAWVAGHGHATRREWISIVLSVGGIGLIAGGGGGGASVGGDLLVLVSVALSAALIAAQPALLRDRDPAAVTAVQFAAAAGFALPFALGSGHLPGAPPDLGTAGAFLALAVAGTVLPFWLFAHGQAWVRPQLAGAFVNLEPVVGAAIGWTLFADPFGPRAGLGVLAVIVGIVVVGLDLGTLAAALRRFAAAGATDLSRRWAAGVRVHEQLLGLAPEGPRLAGQTPPQTPRAASIRC